MTVDKCRHATYRRRHHRHLALRGIYAAAATQRFAERTANNLLHFEFGACRLCSREYYLVRISLLFCLRVDMDMTVFVMRMPRRSMRLMFVRVMHISGARFAIGMFVYIVYIMCHCRFGRSIVFLTGCITCASLQYGKRKRCRKNQYFHLI